VNMIWRWVISLLVWLSADHDRIATEPARAAAAVSAARASIIEEMAAKPAPVPVKSGTTCVSGSCPPRR
jgi:hypothetical protein